MKTKQPTVKAPLPHRVQIIKYGRAITKMIRQARQSRDLRSMREVVEKMIDRLQAIGKLKPNQVAPDGQRISAQDTATCRKCVDVLGDMLSSH